MLKNRCLSILFFLSASIYFNSCKSELFSEGERIYKAYCSNCHMDDGTGLGTLIPPLTDQSYLNKHKEVLPCIILHGQEGQIVVNDKTYNGTMPGVKLTDIQVLNLINYFSNAWGNNLGYTTITDIRKWKSKCDQ